MMTKKKLLLQTIDLIMLPITVLSAFWFKFIRYHIQGFWFSNSPISKTVLRKIGVFPVVNHYYDSFYSYDNLKDKEFNVRELTGIDLNIDGQLSLLNSFNYNSELMEIERLPKGTLNYSFNKGPFLSGDSEILFNMIRSFKPNRIIEIGCGHSSLMIQHAINYNKKEFTNYTCEHTCIEPYENNWLSELDVKVIREKVEDLPITFFNTLQKNDILFIDSTHIIRPQGDVLFEYLQLLPSLNSGVLVHIHDIFTPRDYLKEWLQKGQLFWNEQYLLESFLTFNLRFEVICAVNYLTNDYFKDISKVCPFLTNDRQPGSFWIRCK